MLAHTQIYIYRERKNKQTKNTPSPKNKQTVIGNSNVWLDTTYNDRLPSPLFVISSQKYTESTIPGCYCLLGSVFLLTSSVLDHTFYAKLVQQQRHETVRPLLIAGPAAVFVRTLVGTLI